MWGLTNILRGLAPDSPQAYWPVGSSFAFHITPARVKRWLIHCVSQRTNSKRYQSTSDRITDNRMKTNEQKIRDVDCLCKRGVLETATTMTS